MRWKPTAQFCYMQFVELERGSVVALPHVRYRRIIRRAIKLLQSDTRWNGMADTERDDYGRPAIEKGRAFLPVCAMADRQECLEKQGSGMKRRRVRLALDLITILVLGGRLLDRLARLVGLFGFFLVLLAALLRFILVTDTFGHDVILKIQKW
jgi:hypothetical protein